MRAAHNAKLQEEQRNKNKYMIHAFRVNDTPGAVSFSFNTWRKTHQHYLSQ